MFDTSLMGLFLSSTLAATLLPGGSEAMLLYLATQTDHALFTLWWVATLGNTLGGLINWGLGWLLSRRYPERAPKGKHAARALAWIHRYGVWSLLLAWVPLVGDPLCVAAGWLRLPLLLSSLCIAVGKGLRYALLMWPLVA